MTRIARSIVLIGFMGTGKSKVGRSLAKALGWKQFDTDSMIVQIFGIPIPEIFAQFGEARFRAEESAVLRNLTVERPSIIVSGGGGVLRPENVTRMRELGTVVCLTTNDATLEERLADRNDRPLLPRENRAETIRTLLREREPYYQKAADLTFDTSELCPEEVATLILESLALSR